MKELEKYFSNKAIIKTLCKYRIKQAKKKHKYHLLRDVSLHPKSILFLHNKHNCPPDLKELFPSRRTWLRHNVQQRSKFSNSQDLNINALYKTIITTHIRVINNNIAPPDWYIKLSSFVKNIQERVQNPDANYLQSPIIKPIKKENSKSCNICRPISLYGLIDRLIIGITAKYLTDVFDPYLHDCSYAFRSAKVRDVRTHHDTITEILNYRNGRRNENIWVAECDLKKFFDCVNQKKIILVFERFEQKVLAAGKYIDENAKKIFLQYLLTYSFNKDVYPLNNTKYFEEFNIVDGKFDWPFDELKSQFYGEEINTEVIGIPQGGALSCLIANLILHEVDEHVDGCPKDSDLLFLRFCDDMVLMHISKEKCESGLQRYSDKIKELKLLIHKPEIVKVYGKSFWKTKSKSPYNWNNNNKDKANVPWLAFVGYQIRYDGLIRVRKKSLIKEANKQKNEIADVLKSLDLHARSRENINTHSRKSKRQQIFALENRLISMSVGRVSLFNYRSIKPGLCWTNGFKKINANFISRSQCKYLDRRRNYNLYNFKKELIHLTKDSEKPDKKSKNIYLGHPFSYYGFLLNQS